MANPVQYGLSNVHYAVWDSTRESYEDPISIPGAVSLTLDAEGDSSTFYADNIPYYTTNANNGYSGSLEIAEIPDSVMVDLLGMEYDDDGVLIESNENQDHEFALLFEVSGNEHDKRYCFYNCVLARPSYDQSTVEDAIEPTTATMDITITTRKFDWGDTTRNAVKATVLNEGDTVELYNSWYSSVHVPTSSAAGDEDETD